MHSCCARRHAQGLSGGFEGAHEIFDIWGRCRVEHGRDARDLRRYLLEHLKILATQRAFHSSKTGYIAARPGEARDKAAADRTPTVPKTKGMVRVCCSSVAVVGVVLERMTLGCSATSSFADRCIAAASVGVAQRVSIRAL